ncbi:tripartite tricarboxylate transporter substrate binding protein [Nisaea acidiphila]|uniref:Tripartite tricarboxylate transporter substrate binding protein n=1 Tax=Nisaea acidiphila TaxID=1862145 RepID=A0A9J7ANC3_9PROT|nr:tripartite tricarboxylate transporter substrate binding protein [Nisaea acidiphila]UUX48936.1 tripartite tricarboxylate transporter substrate binding protein [Nisaea acidiphila]
MKLFGKFSTALLAAAAIAVPLAGSANAADYPSKDIMHIMPWSAGGGTDTVMRTFMSYAEKQLGVGINTQNVTGAQSGVGTLRLMKSRPDGYTIGSLTWDSVITVPYYKLVPGYDTDQLAFLGSVTVHPTTLIVKADAPWKTLEEFVAAAKAAPGTLKIANVGTGGVWHLPALDFAAQAGIDVQHIPYPKGSGPQREALLSGETDAASTSISAAFAAVKSGQARVLGVMSDTRSDFFPDVPTFKEQGYDVVWGSFRLIATQTGVDAEQRKTLETAFAKVFDMPDFQKAAADTGMGAVWMNAEETAAYIEASQKKAFALIDELVQSGILKK